MKRLRRALPIVLVAAASLLGAYFYWSRPVAAKVFGDLSLSMDGAERHYRLVVPHSVRAEPAAIVFAFHGMGDSPESMAGYSQLDRLAAKERFILVYPAANRSMWATVNVEEANVDENADIRFFDKLLEHVREAYPIDRARIYLVGMSNGATFAQMVAAVRPQAAAVVAHSGPPPGKLESLRQAFPVLFIVGDQDPAADVIRSAAKERRDGGKPSECIVVPGLGHAWSTSHNQQMWEYLEKNSLKDNFRRQREAESN